MKKNKKIFGIVLITILATLVATILTLINPFQKTQLQLAGYLYKERPARNPIVIVAIDNKSLDVEQGLGKFDSWSREYYAKVIENLEKYQPASIGIDIFFQNENRKITLSELKEISKLSDTEIADTVKDYLYSEIPPGDRKFAEMIRNNPKIVLIPEVLQEQKDFVLRNDHENISIIWPVNYFLTDNFSNIGLNRAFHELDKAIWRTPLIYFVDDQTYLGFSFRNAINQLGVSADNIKFDELNNRIQVGNKIIPLDNTGQMMINYAQKLIYLNKEATNIKLISFVDVYNNNFPEGFDTEILKNNVVLIGAYNSYTNDVYRTPIDPAQPMFGVMIHASAIQTILDEAWLRDMGVGEIIISIFLLSLFSAGVIYSRMKIGFSLVILALLLGFYWLIWGPLLFGNGIIVNMVYPPLAIVLVTIIGYAYRYVTEFNAKIMAAGALSKYVNADVAEKVIDGDTVSTGGEKKEITVIFTDIRGFTTISEGLSPQSLVALLNEYFSIMTAVIVEHGGLVDKFEGDAIMAFFEGEGQAMKAAKATLAMREELHKWKQITKDRPNWPDIEFRAGISTGQAVVGNIGSSDHLQYTAIGDIVNLGSRLESANKFYQTKAMVAEATFELIKDSFECRFLDVIQVKGKEIPVKIYELIAAKGGTSIEQIELIGAYNKALSLYFQRDFAGALRELRDFVLTRWPDDYLAKIYADRCEEFIKNPPPADWNFVQKMESK